MLAVAAVLAIGLLAGVPGARAGGYTGKGHAVEGVVVGVRGAKVRLDGVLAPADDRTCPGRDGMAMSCADASRQALDALLARGPVTCETKKKVGHGSYIGACHMDDGTDVAEAQVAAGWALAAGDAYRDAMSKAEAAGLGAWGPSTD